MYLSSPKIAIRIKRALWAGGGPDALYSVCLESMKVFMQALLDIYVLPRLGRCKDMIFRTYC